MGVTKFWELVKSECPHALKVGVSLKSFIEGRAIAVDLSMWLHEYGRLCAKAVMVNKNYSLVIDHCVHNANILRLMGCDVVFVADNRVTAAQGKAWTNDQRSAKSAAAWEKYQNSPGDDSLLSKAFKVSLDLQEAVLDALRKEDFDCFQAPLEADAQLGMLYREKKVHAVMSADTDCVIHGVEMLIYSWNIHENECNLFSWGLITPIVFPPAGSLSAAGTADFFEKCQVTGLLAALPSGLRMDMLQCYALCSGCDYFKVAGWGPSQARNVLRAGIQHFYDKVLEARGPFAIATWLSTQLTRKSSNGRVKHVNELNICGVTCSKDAIFDLVHGSFLHFGAAPAFSLTMNAFVAGRYHITSFVQAPGTPPLSTNNALQSKVGYSLVELNNDGRVARFIGYDKPDSYVVHLNSIGMGYVEGPIARSTPKAGYDFDAQNANMVALDEFLSPRKAQLPGALSLPLEEKRRVIINFINVQRHSILPEPYLAMSNEFEGMAVKSQPPQFPSTFLNRLSAKIALNEDGSDPRGLLAAGMGSEDTFSWFCCTADEKAVQANAPTLSMSVLLDYFDKTFFHSRCKPLKLGGAMCLDTAHKPLNAKWATDIDSKTAWYKITSPSSLGKNVQYDVSVCFTLSAPQEIGDGDVPDPSVLIPTISKVSHAWCKCRAGVGGRCWHVAYALFCVHNQLLCNSRASQESCTARLQRWHRPPDQYITRLASSSILKSGKVPIFKLGSTAATTLAQDSTTAAIGGRVAYGPPLSAYPTMTDPDFNAQAQSFFTTLKDAYGGVSAVERWHLPLDQLQALREEEYATRKLRAAALDAALREKGVVGAAQLEYTMNQEQRALKKGKKRRRREEGGGLEGDQIAGAEEEENERGLLPGPPPPAAHLPDSAHVLNAKRYPWFRAYPTSVVPNYDVIVQDVNGSTMRVCKWCGPLYKKTKGHWDSSGLCINWEVTPRGQLGTFAEQWAQHQSSKKKTYVAPNVGQSFHDANPHAQKKRK
jgi:hypothetical protein